jgi:hypothetical protein
MCALEYNNSEKEIGVKETIVVYRCCSESPITVTPCLPGSESVEDTAVVFHSRFNAKEVHFIHYKFTYRMYTRTGYKRRNTREEYRGIRKNT